MNYRKDYYLYELDEARIQLMDYQQELIGQIVHSDDPDEICSLENDLRYLSKMIREVDGIENYIRENE